MANPKTATLTFRIDPAIKEVLRAAAEQEHRSLANMVEVMIRDYGRSSGVAIFEQGSQSADSQKSPKGKK